MNKNKRYIINFIIFFILILNAVYWCSRKEGFHYDDIIVYKFLNIAHDKPKTTIINIFTNNYFKNCHDSSFYTHYLDPPSDSLWNIHEVYNCLKLWGAYPTAPVHFFLFEITRSILNSKQFTKWDGLVLNLVFYTFTLIIIYNLSYLLFKSNSLALLSVMLYGTSIGAINTVVFIRPYMVYTFITILFVYFNTIYIYIYGNTISYSCMRKSILYCLIICSIIFGILTHYYFIIFFVFYIGTLIIFNMITMKYKLVKYYVSIIIISIISCLSLWPILYKVIFYSGRGKEAFSNISTYTDFIYSIERYYHIINTQICGGYGRIIIVISLIILYYLIVSSLSCRLNGLKNIRTCCISIDICNISIIVLAITLLLYFFMISKISPYKTDRYIFNIYPLIYILIIYIVKLITLKNKYILYGFRLFIVSMNCINYNKIGIRYLYTGTKQFLDKISNIDHISISVTQHNNTWEEQSNMIYFTKSNMVFPLLDNRIDYLNVYKNHLYQKNILLYIHSRVKNKKEICTKIANIIDNNSTFNFFFKGERYSVYILNR